MIRLACILLSCSLVGTIAASCDSPLGTQAVAGTYVLERVGDAALPVVVTDNPDASYSILADTFRIHSDHTATEARVARTELHAGGTPPRVDHSHTEFLYRLQGGRIILTYPPCADGVACTFLSLVPPPTGYFTADGLVLDSTPEFVYRRID
jgi:hypothetical protein